MFMLDHDTKVTLGVSAFVCALIVGGVLLVTSGESNKQKYSPQNFLDAVQRMHPMSDKICIDSSSSNAYLIHYADGIDENWVGWYWINGIGFSDYGNKKISAEEVTGTDRYHKVFPDVTGLTCLEKL